jgi:hypothetical protein
MKIIIIGVCTKKQLNDLMLKDSVTTLFTLCLRAWVQRCSKEFFDSRRGFYERLIKEGLPLPHYLKGYLANIVEL